jgi:lipoprotein-anchoring transpeptidase ErfK/SrfK
MAQPINDLKMKHTTTLFLLALLALTTLSCGGNKGTQSPQPTDMTADQDTAMRQVITHPDTAFNRDSAFIVVSKQDLTLTVYAPVAGDTLAIEAFPVCMGKNKGNKEKSGDMRTPESPAGQPFTITMIQDASGWEHDFGDGRGSILSYGHWFLRLKTPHNGIGIHGSTNNENTVPGRASEGCIRLLDKDIITLKERYARVGMPVIVKGEDQGLMPFEEKCLTR